MSRFIYLIEAEIGLLKIGNSRDPETRLKSFAANSVCPVRLIAKWPGSIADEMALHSRFADLRSYNEWFLIEGSLADFAAEKRGLNVVSPPDWDMIRETTASARRKAGDAAKSDRMKALWSDAEWRARQLAKRTARHRLMARQ